MGGWPRLWSASKCSVERVKIMNKVITMAKTDHLTTLKLVSVEILVSELI